MFESPLRYRSEQLKINWSSSNHRFQVPPWALLTFLLPSMSFVNVIPNGISSASSSNWMCAGWTGLRSSMVILFTSLGRSLERGWQLVTLPHGGSWLRPLRALSFGRASWQWIYNKSTAPVDSNLWMVSDFTWSQTPNLLLAQTVTLGFKGLSIAHIGTVWQEIWRALNSTKTPLYFFNFLKGHK